MRPLHVVVRGVLGQHPAEVPLPEDQHAVGQLGPNGQHEALGEAVRPRAPRRDLDHLDTRIGQDRVERGRELSRSVPDQEPEPPDVLAEIHHEVAGLLRSVASCLAKGVTALVVLSGGFADAGRDGMTACRRERREAARVSVSSAPKAREPG